MPNCNPHIKTITPLKRQNNTAQALELLEKLSNHVFPIMKNRQWKVDVLTEMYPTNPNLLGLNVNRGKAIRIRLRYAHNKDEFIPWHDLIGTMLHELVHIIQGPHDVKFYKILDDLFQEYESSTNEIERNQGFKLGGKNLNQNEMKKFQLESIEKRRWLNGIMPNGGQRLGGRTLDEKNLDLKTLIRMAAEKRVKDSIWCGSDEPIILQTKRNRSNDGVEDIGNLPLRSTQFEQTSCVSSSSITTQSATESSKPADLNRIDLPNTNPKRLRNRIDVIDLTGCSNCKPLWKEQDVIVLSDDD
ncbi:WLM domain-containing protein [Globomyces pollinis-pini]|nr:WLM domain-containing protein [Globomyces pollinis-pini]